VCLWRNSCYITADIVGITVTKIKQVTVNLYHTTSDPNVSILKCFRYAEQTKRMSVLHLISGEGVSINEDKNIINKMM